jgi:hypothetical protein
MFIRFRRSKVTEDVVEVAPAASAFLGDSSMRYVRVTISYLVYSWQKSAVEIALGCLAN